MGVRVAVVVSATLDAVVGASGGCVTGSWATIELVVALLAASERTARVLEFRHAHGGQSRGGVVLSGVVVDLMDRDSGVHDMWLDRLAVDHGLGNVSGHSPYQWGGRERRHT